MIGGVGTRRARSDGGDDGILKENGRRERQHHALHSVPLDTPEGQFGRALLGPRAS